MRTNQERKETSKREHAERMVREKVEKSVKKEALTTHFIAYLPFVLTACVMAATGVPTVLYTIVILTGLFVAMVIYLSMKSYAYKKHYEKYLEEFTILRGAGDKE